MGEKVELRVDADFTRIISDLQSLQKKASGVGDHLKRAGDELDKNLQRNTKRTEQHFERLRDLGRRLADQLRGYFADIAGQAAMALEGVKKNLGLKQQFVDATRGAVELHDVIRKISGSLDIATGRVSDFQQSLTKAFTDLGFGTDEAARALEGIAGTTVRGEGNITQYATTATQLAQVGGQQGQEGEIAKGLANVLRERGVDPNDMKAMRELAEAVRGRNPSDKLGWMESMYGGMAPEKRQQIGPEALRGIMAVRKEIGPEIDSLVRELTEGMLKRLPKEAQGLGKLVGAQGIDFEALEKQKGLLRRIGFDKVASAQTAGFSEEAAKALVKLLERPQAAKEAQKRAMGEREGSMQEGVEQSRGLMDNMGAVKNRVTGTIGGFIAPAIDKANQLVGKAAQSTTGSALLMGGGFLAAAAGAFGLSKLGKAMGGKLGGAGSLAAAGARAAALEQITGQKTVPVFVVNASEIGGGGSGKIAEAAADMSKSATLMAKVGILGAAGAAGFGVGSVINDIIDKNTQGTSEDGEFKGNIVERMMYAIDKGLEKLGDKIGQTKDSAGHAIGKALEEANQMRKHGRLNSATKNDRRGAANANSGSGE